MKVDLDLKTSKLSEIQNLEHSVESFGITKGTLQKCDSSLTLVQKYV